MMDLLLYSVLIIVGIAIPLFFGLGFIGFIWDFVANRWRTPEFWGGLIFFAMVTWFWL
jgi:hypothetical protein